MTVIDGATKGTTTVATGANPSAVAINPITNKIYVSNTGSDSVTPAFATCNAPDVAVITTGETPATFKISVSTTGLMHSASLTPTSRIGQTAAATQFSQLGVAGLMFACVTQFGRRKRLFRPCTHSHRPSASSPLHCMHIGSIRAGLCLWMLLICVSGTALLTGCGGGDGGTTPPTNPPPPAQSTPPGTYTLTVAATVGTHAQTTKLTLVVQ